jgi:hypothetical protein
MKTVEPRSLLGDLPIMIEVDQGLMDVFIAWKKIFEEKTGGCPNNIDCMYAGYILANPIVREQFKNYNKVINPK